MNKIEGNTPHADQAQPTFEIRPGVNYPDWSVVTSDLTRSALTDINDAIGIEKWFADYDADEDRVWMGILRYFAEHGRAPTITELASEVNLLKTKVAVHVSRLKKKDLVVLDETMEQIIGAYPFTERTTEHVVEINGQQVHAMCAIDALGAGSMFDANTTIKSSCRATGKSITVELKSNGAEIKSVDPKSAVVWSGIQVSNGCAAESLCTVLAFFSSDQTFEIWRSKEHPNTPGYRLSIHEGLQVGRAIFDPFLAI